MHAQMREYIAVAIALKRNSRDVLDDERRDAPAYVAILGSGAGRPVLEVSGFVIVRAAVRLSIS